MKTSRIIYDSIFLKVNMQIYEKILKFKKKKKKKLPELNMRPYGWFQVS